MLELEDPRPDDREDPCPELLPELMLPLLNLPNRPPRLRPPAALPPDPPDLLKRPLNFPIKPPLPDDLPVDLDDPWLEDEVILWPEDVEPPDLLPLPNLANKPPSPPGPPDEEDPPDLLNNPLNFPINPPLPDPDDEELPPLLKRPLNLPIIPPEDVLLPEDPWPEDWEP